MTPSQFVAELRARGVALAVNDGALLYDGPEDALTEKVLALMARRKPALLALLADEPPPGAVGSEFCACGRVVWRYAADGLPRCQECGGDLPPLPALPGGYEPGEDREVDAEPPPPARPVDFVYKPGETPRYCAACDVELVNLKNDLCGPCRWRRQQEALAACRQDAQSTPVRAENANPPR